MPLPNELRPSGKHGGGLDSRDLEGLLNSPQFASIAKEFVHPGDSVTNLLMRSVLKDRRELNAAILFLRKCEEFHIKAGQDLLRYLLAGATSIGGTARRELLQAVTGTLDSSLYNNRFQKTGKDNSPGRDGGEQ